jgi:hypothetical protein
MRCAVVSGIASEVCLQDTVALAAQCCRWDIAAALSKFARLIGAFRPRAPRLHRNVTRSVRGGTQGDWYWLSEALVSGNDFRLHRIFRAQTESGLINPGKANQSAVCQQSTISAQTRQIHPKPFRS